ncbi:hypothetical protein, partial [Streptomyces sp. 6N223]|uniref:hypothetical protein n=1 Tax=Streptomyces sp. 6N223 TaxID=3457412 RepID=UPI003FD49ADF
MSEPGVKRWTVGFSLFGEVVITGVMVGLLALPVVTALPALAAGTAHLRRHLTGGSVRVPDALRDFVQACRSLWRPALGFTGAALLLLWNLSLGQAGVVPGSGGVVAVSALLIAAWAVLLLRTAVAWRPEDVGDARDARDAREPDDWASAWPQLLRRAAEQTWRDPGGSVLLAFACVMCGVFVWMLLPLALLVGGLLA